MAADIIEENLESNFSSRTMNDKVELYFLDKLKKLINCNDKNALQRKEEALRDKEKNLRRKEEALRNEKQTLLQQQQQQQLQQPNLSLVRPPLHSNSKTIATTDIRRWSFRNLKKPYIE